MKKIVRSLFVISLIVGAFSLFSAAEILRWMQSELQKDWAQKTLT